MPYRPQVSQWRQYTTWEGQSAPPDLLLAIIGHESGGFAGRQAGVKCKAGELPRVNGEQVTVDRALGLMQCIPSSVQWYNQHNPNQPAYYDDMIGNTERASRMQIRVGAFVYRNNVAQLHRYDPVLFPGSSPGGAPPNQLILALLAYAVGFGALRKRLEQLKERGAPLNIKSIQEQFPNWGKKGDKWINRPVHYAVTVWQNYLSNRSELPATQGPTNPAGQPELALAKIAPKSNSAIIVAALLGAWFVAKKFFAGEDT